MNTTGVRDGACAPIVRTGLAIAAILTVSAGAPARAQEWPSEPDSPALRSRLFFQMNEIGVAGRGARYADVLAWKLDGNLDRLIGWSGASAHLDLVHSYSEGSNRLVGSLQGVDDNDIPNRHVRLYQAWIDQSFANHRASLRAGVYDLETEFAKLGAAEQLINPSFRLSPELARAGPNSAPAFPSTSLGVRLRLQPQGAFYLMGAALNAQAGTVGDRHGIDAGFDKGALVLGEVGVRGAGKIALGAWRYTRDQPDIRDRTAAGSPVMRVAQGVYGAVEAPLTGSPGQRNLSLFARAGLSDGATTPLEGGWQAGLRLRGVFEGRPDSSLSLGVAQAVISSRFRRISGGAGRSPGSTETVFELTYSDRVLPILSIQPDLQWVRRPRGGAGTGDVVIIGVRATAVLDTAKGLTDDGRP